MPEKKGFFDNMGKQIVIIIISLLIGGCITFVANSMNLSRKNRESILIIEEHMATIESEVIKTGAAASLNASESQKIRIDVAQIKGYLGID